MAIPLSPFPNPVNPIHKPNPSIHKPFSFIAKPVISSLNSNPTSKRHLLLKTSLLCFTLIPQLPLAQSSAEALPSKSLLSSIENTKSWFQFYGDGFAIRVPPEFQDINEPEDYNAGLSLYGDKAKPKTFAARFSSPDGSEVLSVVTRPTNQLKITFLEAQDITDLGSLKNAARIFVPGGATLYSARTIKIKEDDEFRTYYFYEFGRYEEHVALMAGVSSGKAIIAGATAPQSEWDSDGVKLRSAADFYENFIGDCWSCFLLNENLKQLQNMNKLKRLLRFAAVLYTRPARMILIITTPSHDLS